MPEVSPACEKAFSDWWVGVAPFLPATRDAAREAFCTGWEALATQLGSDHYVIFTEDRWTVEHSVECRLSGHMPECEYHAAIAFIADELSPDMAGRWLIVSIDGGGLPDLMRADLIGGFGE